jgi:cytochrome c-type biogenesis protein
MEGLFTQLTIALEGALPLALGAAFLWGMLSIVLSPCHLASLPLIVAFIGGQETRSRQRAWWLSTLFALGILITVALLGAVTAASGRIMGDIGAVGNVAVAGIFLLFGLVLLDLIPLQIPGINQVAMKRKGAWAALLMGLVFGVALGPCTFAFMAPVLALGFQVAAQHAWQGLLLVICYGMGHCLVIALFGGSAAWVQKTLDWNASSRAGQYLKKICGFLIILAGFYLLYTARS